MGRIRLTAWTVIMAAAGLLLTSCTSSAPSPASSGSPSSASASGFSGGGVQADAGIHKIKHVVIIMQENRSFDSFFGTYPGADGIPAKNGQFTVCVPDPRTGGCDKPYHDPSLVNGGAGHNLTDATTDIDGGKMDGFVKAAEDTVSRGCSATKPPTPVCLPSSTPDVMGYHDAREIPNYWTYGHDFVLTDHMFEPVDSWSLPSHLYLVSGWSAHCTSTNPNSCVSDPAQAQGRLRIKNLPSAFLACMRAQGVTALKRADLTNPKVIAAASACLGALTPAQRQLLLGNGGEGQQLGYIDHQTLSFDAYNKFIEDDFLNGARLDPKTDGRPDSRPDVREDATILGNLYADFNFNQQPRPPVLLSTHPAPGPASVIP
jgi:Phosphoesterase family